MRWTASAPVTWPGDAAWQRAWTAMVAPVLSSRAGADGVVPTSETAPRVLLTDGIHLAPGANYVIAPELTRGTLRAWVAAGRAVGVEWAPHDEPGRAHVEVHGLDRLDGLRAESTLRHLAGRASLDPLDPARPADLTLDLDWLQVEVGARVRQGRLELDLGLRGRGGWWPTLAPLLAVASGRIRSLLEETVQELATGITGLPTADLSDRPLTGGPTPAERQDAHTRMLRAGIAEAARRQRAVADVLAALPWWRRTGRRWREQLTALGPGLWPGEDPMPHQQTWDGAERTLVTLVLRERRWRRVDRLDAVVARWGDALVARRRDFDALVEGAGSTDAAPRPWLTDETVDLGWLSSPWSAARHLMGAGSDAEAEAQARALARSRDLPGASS